MKLRIRSRLDYAFEKPTDVLVQVEAAALDDQWVETATIALPEAAHVRRIPGHDGLGDRILMDVADRLTVDYEAVVHVRRPVRPLAALAATPPHDVPFGVVEYLLPSRYCPSDEFETFVESEFAGLSGGERAAAIEAFVRATVIYEMGASDGTTTARDTIVSRRGVCRDFAHVVVTLARASGIPARVVSGYAPGVVPADFHLVAQLFLGGGWHVVDATGMATCADLAIIGVGRDAADVAFLTSWGNALFLSQSVIVTAEAQGSSSETGS